MCSVNGERQGRRKAEGERNQRGVRGEDAAGRQQGGSEEGCRVTGAVRAMAWGEVQGVKGRYVG